MCDSSSKHVRCLLGGEDGERGLVRLVLNDWARSAARTSTRLRADVLVLCGPPGSAGALADIGWGRRRAQEGDEGEAFGARRGKVPSTARMLYHKVQCVSACLGEEYGPA